MKPQSIALILAYDGRYFHGFQRQISVASVQATLEQALTSIANHPVVTYCAGRTDAAVHATNQVIHFTTTSNRPLSAWINGVNSKLPNSIRIKQAFLVDDQFHARFSAKSRSYRYLIINSAIANPHFSGLATQIAKPLNVALMQQAAQDLLGEQDFSSFRAVGCQSNSPYRNISQAEFKQYGDLIIFEITANAFLYHMVRNIMGALLAIGLGEESPQFISYLLQVKDRKLAPATAKADGLYLIKANYPDYPEVSPLHLGPLHF